MTTVAMNSLWTFLESLSLSRRNRKWLAERLIAMDEKRESDSTRMTKEEYFAKLERAEKQLERGEGIEFTDRDAMNAWLDAL